MNKNDYLSLLTEQIRNKRARQAIECEMSNHIDDQITDYIAEGMIRAEAEEAAVNDMGDPVKTGVSLDMVHKPKMNWGFYGFVVAISIFSMALMWIVKGNTYDVGVAIFGLICMTIICFMDYTFFCRNVNKVLFLFVMCFAVTFLGVGFPVDGARAFLWLPFGNSISLVSVMYLYVPIYAVILFHSKNGGYPTLLRCVAFLILPVFLTIEMPNMYLTMNMLFILLVMLSVAIYKNWFQVKKVSWLIGLWFVFAFIPMITSIVICYTRGFTDHFSRHFVVDVESTEWIKDAVLESVNGYHDAIVFSDYYMAYMLQYFGTIVVVLAVAALLIMISKVFQISIRQSNQQGQMIGIGCGLIFAVQTVEYVLVNFYMIPNMSGYLPFFSSGGTSEVVSYILLGFVLSVYRYQSIPYSVKRSQKAFTQRIGGLINAKK